MKITIENFGPIHRFEIDLSKNISLIYGKNNIGKSYAISVVYMLLKSFPVITKGEKLRSEIAALTHGDNPEKVVLPGSAKFILSQFLDNTFSENFKRLLKSSYGDLKNVRNQFQTNVASIHFETQSLSFRFVLFDKNEFKGGIVQLHYRESSLVREQEFSYTSNELNDTCYSVIRDFYREIIPFITGFYYIPAVRSGIYLAFSNLGSIISEINQYQGVIGQQSFTLPNTTVPVSDFYSQISNKSAFNFGDEYNYKSVVQNIEKNILDGTVQIDTQTGRLLYFSNKLQLTFDLSQVSSMVSELSIITAYFKYIIRDHVSLDNFDGEASLSVGVFPTLFIEEPESHIHPEAQLKLMEYFVGLSKLGLKIIMTTHSDYMFNKLGNEILAGNIKASDAGSYLLEMEENGSICSKSKMQPDDTGIEDDNFLSVTEQLYRERIKLNDEYYERIDRENTKP